MTNQPADSYESRLRAVLGVVHRYLPPDGIGAKEALSEITALVDPWPVLVSSPIEAAQTSVDKIDKLAIERYSGAIHTERSGKLELWPIQYREVQRDAFKAGYKAALASAPIEAAQTSADYDWKAIAQHYEAALRHIAQSAFASKDWQYARDALASPAAAVRLASAPPAAATVGVPDERKAFEAWAVPEGYQCRWREASDKSESGYDDVYSHYAWGAWQARAALSTPTAQKAEGGEVPVADSVANEARLHRAARALASQSGTPADQFVDWLCGGGLAEMALSHFARPTPAAAAPQQESNQDRLRRLKGDSAWLRTMIASGEIWDAGPLTPPAAAAGVPPDTIEIRLPAPIDRKASDKLIDAVCRAVTRTGIPITRVQLVTPLAAYNAPAGDSPAEGEQQ